MNVTLSANPVWMCMQFDLTRLTVRYDPTEDRLCLLGESAHGNCRLWLSERLLRRLVPALLDRLAAIEGRGDGLDADRGVRSEARPLLQAHQQQFAQQAAMAQLPMQSPVADDRLVAEGLLSSVDLVFGGEAIGLRFKASDRLEASLTLMPDVLRQWLGIVHAQCRDAGWRLDYWPGWLDGGSATRPASAPIH